MMDANALYDTLCGRDLVVIGVEDPDSLEMEEAISRAKYHEIDIILVGTGSTFLPQQCGLREMMEMELTLTRDDDPFPYWYENDCQISLHPKSFDSDQVRFSQKRLLMGQQIGYLIGTINHRPHVYRIRSTC